jgi:multiple sugar transport system substrate-binding protein
MSNHINLKSCATALALGLSLTVFGNASAQEAVNLRMTIWSANEAHLKLFNDMAAGFKQSHPNVTVTYESLPFETYTTALTTPGFSKRQLMILSIPVLSIRWEINSVAFKVTIWVR